ncbi:MAG: efflux RND transporter permease subunit [Rhizomicrobium sp.]
MTRIVDWAGQQYARRHRADRGRTFCRRLCVHQYPKEAQPDIPIPYLIVQVTYAGISPEDSERLLVKPLETALRSVEGLKTITARAYSGVGVIILEFDVNFKKEKALNDVRAKVDEARSLLPAEADPPTVQEINTALQPVISAALYGDVPDRTLLKLARSLKDEMKVIPTVLDVDIDGERKEMLEIVIDPAKLETFGISQQEMFNAVSNNNRLIAAGLIDTGHGSLRRESAGRDRDGKRSSHAADPFDREFDDHAERRGAGAPHLLRSHDLCARERPADDLARRHQAHRREHHRQHAAVKAAVEKAQKTWPAGVHVTYLFDESTDIHDMLSSLSDSIILAIILVMIIIVAALGVRAGLLVGVAIPTSFLMAFMVLNGLGMSLNEMIMFGMLLAVGILVDGAIIVVEYADRKMTEGYPPKGSLRAGCDPHVLAGGERDGNHDRRVPADAFVAGHSRKFMSFFPITLIIVLSASMIVALIFLPVLGGFFGKRPPHDEAHEKASKRPKPAIGTISRVSQAGMHISRKNSHVTPAA